MLLAVDVGNTNIVLGVYERNKLLISWRVSTNRLQTSDEYGVILKNLFKQAQMDTNAGGIIISSVCPFNVCFRGDGATLFPFKAYWPRYKTGLNLAVDIKGGAIVSPRRWL